MHWILLILLALIIIFAFMSIKIVKQSEVYIIERLGKFHKVADAGLTIIIPFIDHVRSIVSLKQQTLDIAPQEVITKDNVTITINTVVFYKIVDPAKAVYEIQNLKKGIEYLSVTAMRDLVGKMDLDSTFSSRDMINDKLRAILDEATCKWGCTIDRVEVYASVLDTKQHLVDGMNPYYSFIDNNTKIVNKNFYIIIDTMIEILISLVVCTVSANAKVFINTNDALSQAIFIFDISFSVLICSNM